MDKKAAKKSNKASVSKSQYAWVKCSLCHASGHSVIYCPQMSKTSKNNLIPDLQEKGVCTRCLKKTSDCSGVSCGLAFNARNTQYFSTDCPSGCQEDGKKLNKRICGHIRTASGGGRAAAKSEAQSAASIAQVRLPSVRTVPLPKKNAYQDLLISMPPDLSHNDATYVCEVEATRYSFQLSDHIRASELEIERISIKGYERRRRGRK